MSKFPSRFSTVIVAFVIVIFAVAGWLYYQESQKIQVIVPNARRDALLFDGYGDNGGINRITELGGLEKLRETRLAQGDIEIRIWRDGFSLEGVFLRRIDGLWEGQHVTTNKYNEPEKVQVKRLFAPKSGWTAFWKQLDDKEILTLPQSTESACDATQMIDGIGYVVEINQNKTYRTYFYPDGIGKVCREAKQMNEIGELIGLEFDSGLEECKTTEWFACMTLRKSLLQAK